MRENTFSIIITVSIVLAVSGTFLYGQNLIHGPIKKGYTAVYFLNNNSVTEKIKSSNEDLGVEIYNQNEKSATYQITFYLNDEPAVSSEVDIQPGQKKTILPSLSIIEKMSALRSNEFEFKADITADGSTQSIHKKLTFLK